MDATHTQEQEQEHDDPIVQAFSERIDAVAEAFDELNRTLPDSFPGGFQIPAGLDRIAHLDALTDLLIGAGIVDEAALVRNKAERMALLFEAALEGATTLKQKMLGGGLVAATPGDVAQMLQGQPR